MIAISYVHTLKFERISIQRSDDEYGAKGFSKIRGGGFGGQCNRYDITGECTGGS